MTPTNQHRCRSAIRRVAAVLTVVPVLFVALGAPAHAQLAPTSDAEQLARAMMRDTARLAAASFVALPPSGTPHGVSSQPFTYFPTHDGEFAILTTGDVNYVPKERNYGIPGADLGGENVRGNTDFDVTILRVDLDVAPGQNCLRFDFQFLSQEYPDWLGSVYNDAFIAELNMSTWSTSSSTISAPDNFAFDAEGEVISINTTGFTGMDPKHSVGTTYGGAIPLLRAATPIPSGNNNGLRPGNNSLYLSIFDQGDRIWDSGVFVDNLVVGTVPNPAVHCRPGAKLLSILEAQPLVDVDAGEGGLRLEAKLTEMLTRDPLAGRTVEFYTDDPVTGSQLEVCAAQTDENGVATCSAVGPVASAVIGGGYTAIFGGDDEYQGSEDDAPAVRALDRDVP